MRDVRSIASCIMNLKCRAGFVLLALAFSSVAKADPVPGLIRALSELHDAYGTFSAVKTALDDAEKNIKPSTDFSAASARYQSAAESLSKTQPPLEPSKAPPPAPVSSCPARASAIPQLSSGIALRQADLQSLQSENAQLAKAAEEVNRTFDVANSFETAIPKIAAIPIWGDSIAAEIFSMTQKVRKSAGDAQSLINKRAKQNSASVQLVSASINEWSKALNQATQFSSASMPAGSYIRSCGACSYDCENITCSCRRVNGYFNRTGIKYNLCQSLENNNGNLQCGP